MQTLEGNILETLVFNRRRETLLSWFLWFVAL